MTRDGLVAFATARASFASAAAAAALCCSPVIRSISIRFFRSSSSRSALKPANSAFRTSISDSWWRVSTSNVKGNLVHTRVAGLLLSVREPCVSTSHLNELASLRYEWTHIDRSLRTERVRHRHDCLHLQTISNVRRHCF